MTDETTVLELTKEQLEEILKGRMQTVGNMRIGTHECTNLGDAKHRMVCGQVDYHLLLGPESADRLADEGQVSIYDLNIDIYVR